MFAAKEGGDDHDQNSLHLPRRQLGGLTAKAVPPTPDQLRHLVGAAQKTRMQ
jgi:hypothetical protein